MAKRAGKGKSGGGTEGDAPVGGKGKGKAKGPKRRRAPLVDRVTTLVLLLFLASLAVPHLVP